MSEEDAITRLEEQKSPKTEPPRIEQSGSTERPTPQNSPKAEPRPIPPAKK